LGRQVAVVHLQLVKPQVLLVPLALPVLVLPILC
jgi:hypothetical protein